VHFCRLTIARCSLSADAGSRLAPSIVPRQPSIDEILGVFEQLRATLRRVQGGRDRSVKVHDAPDASS
jgi:hypothetical protein